MDTGALALLARRKKDRELELKTARDALHDAIAEALREGIPQHVIAEATGYRREQIRRIGVEHGIRYTRPGRRPSAEPND